MSKLAWRRFWFQVHKWIGLILAIVIIPVCLTGSALVWHDALDRMVNPSRYAVSGETMLRADAYAAAARAVLKPGERVAQMTMPDDGGPVIVAAAQPPAKGAARGGRAPRTNVYLDPPTARVLDVASSRSGLVQFLHVLHGSLQVPGVGRQIVGWIGVFLMVSSFTGLWLWWPTVGKWARGLRWGRHRNTDTNLHYLMGFWIAVPLFMLSLTGAWISFPQFFAGLSGGGGAPSGPPRGSPTRPVEAPAQSVASVIERARAVTPGAVRSVTFPTEQKADWTVAIGGGEGVRPVSVAVADDSGVAALSREAPRGTATARLMRRLHDGTGMGIVWQVVIFIGGILPAALAVTGVIMWWRARGWKRELAGRKRARRDVVAAE
jgi:uncharacterized iron-regulated membrane protein